MLIPRRDSSGARDYSHLRLPPGTTVRLHVTSDSEEPDIDDRVTVASVPKRYAPKLSPMETDILQWMAYGKKYGEVAMLLNITANAVYQHCHRIYNKLGVPNPIAAVAVAIRRGMIK